jgi:tripeptide aminopeptidase
MSVDVLLTEGVAEKFMRYVRLDTASCEESEGVPSTQGQWELARMLEDELRRLGLADVSVDEHCFVIGRLPSNMDQPAPAVGFVAHMDTAPGVPGRGIAPVVHRKYQGGDICIGHGVVLRPDESPDLARAIGCDIITSDGSTLLGADDKAGVAEIMQALVELITNPSIVRPDVWVAFTPDEEIGRGVERFPYAAFGAKVAYTLDGTALGELSEETFNAVNGVATIEGVSSHTGDARGKMVNALHLAAQLISWIPASWRPETTSDREGFIHVNDIQGNVEKVSIKILIRDFDSAMLETRRAALVSMLELLEAAHPGSRASFEAAGGYRNMKEGLDTNPQVVGLALRAMEMAGLTPRTLPIRGGTDGARMTYEGVLTPNLFTGSGDVHSRREWACVQWMSNAVDVVVNLVQLWAEQPQK